MSAARPSAPAFGRRSLLLAAAALTLHGRGARAAPAPSTRIAAIDWAAAETLVAIGIAPIAIADLDGFRAGFAEVDLPGATADLGSVWEPNLELLDRMKPDVIYVPGWSRLSQPQLDRIAPTKLCDIHGSGGDPVSRARAFASALVADFPDAPRALAIAEFDRRLAAVRNSVKRRRIVLLNLRNNTRFVNVYAKGSLPGTVAAHIGLENAWRGAVNGFGFAAIGVEKLVEAADASIVVLNQNGQTGRTLGRLSGNAIWSVVPAVRHGRLHVSPPVSVFGGIASATGLAEWLESTFRDEA